MLSPQARMSSHSASSSRTALSTTSIAFRVLSNAALNSGSLRRCSSHFVCAEGDTEPPLPSGIPIAVVGTLISCGGRGLGAMGHGPLVQACEGEQPSDTIAPLGVPLLAD